MAYFFFGTLMDREVLERVLDRAVSDGDLNPAHLSGFRRVRTAHAPYPMLVPGPGRVVGGMLLKSASARDERRIAHFEDEEYASHWITVRSAHGVPVRARVLFAATGIRRTDEPWDLETWACVHKEAYLQQCREWMRDCPE